MSQTFIPRFLAAGGRLAADVRVNRLQRSNGRWRITACHAPRLSASRNIEISADKVFVACGAIHTPSLLRSEEHTSELQSLMRISYAVFCLQKKLQGLVGAPARSVHFPHTKPLPATVILVFRVTDI